MNAPELAEHAGVTYRQLDYWVRAGYVKAKPGHQGSGHLREFSYVQSQQCAWMARLVKAGFTVDKAAAMAHGDKQARMAAMAALTDGWLEESA